MTEPAKTLDERVAAWIPTVNRGVPGWKYLSPEGREWWRDRYIASRGGV